MSRDKDWIAGKRGPMPAERPTEVCQGCDRKRNTLSMYAVGGGQRLCYACVRGEKVTEPVN